MFRNVFISILGASLLVAAPAKATFDVDSIVRDGLPVFEMPAEAYPTQSCTSRSQAVDQVRRRGDVQRVISAETKVSGGREVHHIRYQTKDGKIKTQRVQGCRV